MELTNSFEALLQSFAPAFTTPSFVTFRLLMTGWILSTRHRYVTDLIVSSDSVGHGHFSDYHRFFSQAAWQIDDLWRLLAKLIVDRLVGKDAVIVLAGDDTLCRKRGLGIFGTGMHHDALSSSRSKKVCQWGHDWVDLCIVIAHPWWAPSKVFSLVAVHFASVGAQWCVAAAKGTQREPGRRSGASGGGEQGVERGRVWRREIQRRQRLLEAALAGLSPAFHFVQDVCQ